ncbi:MAG: hypothetical protein E6G98_08600, partial [Bacillati bacterium ANGP1]
MTAAPGCSCCVRVSSSAGSLCNDRSIAMRRVGFILCASLVVVVAAAGVGAQPAQKVRPPEDKGGHVADEVLVAFRDKDHAHAVARAVGARVGRVLEGLGVYVLIVPAGSVEGTVRALTHNPMVEYAEPNGYLHAFVTPDDPYLSSCYTTSHDGCVIQWSWATVNAYGAWDVTTGSASVRVAVVDTGIDVGDPNYPYFPDLTGHEDIVSCQSPIIRSFVSGESGDDDNGHGTHVAGIIGACANNSRGVAGANWS